MKLYHAFRMDTVSGYAIFLDEDKDLVDARFAKWREWAGESLEGYALGTVLAEDKDSGASAVLNGNWQYTELL